MPKVTVSPNGINGGFGGFNSAPKARGALSGWSAGSARRNMRFLQSIDPDGLDGFGLAITLTVRDCPPSHGAWSTLRHTLVKRLARRGLLRLHWVTEWQKRGAPHFHISAYFSERPFLEKAGLVEEIISIWCNLTSDLGTQKRGQHVEFIQGALGWLRYVAKHASRGHAHYQRERGCLPEGWQKTGRLWGKSGDWPTSHDSVEMDSTSFYRLRRILRRYLIAEARTALFKARRYGNARDMQQAAQRLLYVRHMLRRNDRNVSSVRGVSEWVPEHVTKRAINLLSLYGEIRRVET